MRGRLPPKIGHWPACSLYCIALYFQNLSPGNVHHKTWSLMICPNIGCNLNDLQRLLKQLNIYESTFVLMKIPDHLQRVPGYILNFTLFGAQWAAGCSAPPRPRHQSSPDVEESYGWGQKAAVAGRRIPPPLRPKWLKSLHCIRIPGEQGQSLESLLHWDWDPNCCTASRYQVHTAPYSVLQEIPALRLKPPVCNKMPK